VPLYGIAPTNRTEYVDLVAAAYSAVCVCIYQQIKNGRTRTIQRKRETGDATVAPPGGTNDELLTILDQSSSNTGKKS